MYGVGVFVILFALGTEGSPLSARSRVKQEVYLRRFGYLDSQESSNDLDFVEAVKKFQWSAGLNQTGIVDDETRMMMETPRCGVTGNTVDARSRGRRRRKRYALEGSKWHKRNLTYRINNYPMHMKKETVDEEIRAAFQVWSNASTLAFVAVDSKHSRVDIDLDFARGYHGDEVVFDGPGGVLAHAYFPGSGGNVHFDGSERWTSKSYFGTNLLQVAIHELGHSLGLGHSNVRWSTMAPFYRSWEPRIQLHSDDISGIRYLYGTRRVDHDMTPPVDHDLDPKPKDPELPDICWNATLDAIFGVNDYVYAFQGNLFYKLHHQRIVDGYPKAIGAAWPGLPDNVDAAFHWSSKRSSTADSRHIYFFKGDKCWRYDDQRRPSKDNPQNISKEFPGLPSGIDAAFVWGRNNKLYFIKDEQYYRYENGDGIGPGYPKSTKIWKGLPDKIDAAFRYVTGKTYFFSGQKFYRFNDRLVRVEPNYPKLTATHWFNCPSILPKKTPESHE